MGEVRSNGLANPPVRPDRLHRPRFGPSVSTAKSLLHAREEVRLLRLEFLGRE